MSKAIVKVMVDPLLISQNTEIIARIFTVTDDRKGLFYLLSRLSLELFPFIPVTSGIVCCFLILVYENSGTVSFGESDTLLSSGEFTNLGSP